MSDAPANRLIHETSPYLLQHAHNPVDWYPWGPEALERARREDIPIFLSIGYSACHWCHVMERESFEDERIAAVMNENFVCIKVDREERPDLDDLYMAAVQLLSGQGGWPMSVWLTPDLKPFFGGTYFPPEDHHGRPGFLRVLSRLSEVYRTHREDIERGGSQIIEQIQSFAEVQEGAGLLTAGLFRMGADSLLRTFDRAEGGFGSAPKFPHSMGIQLLLRQYQRSGDLSVLQAATVTLDAMAKGGIYDHLGGGFHRYSTDARWLVPHFEKMLYDQALLVPAYLEGFQVTGSDLYKDVVQGTLSHVLRDMTSPEGGFYSTLDADSEGEEGKYYVWSRSEILSILGPEDGNLFCRAYDVEEQGNFEGQAILHPVLDPAGLTAWAGGTAEEAAARLAGARERLLQERGMRVSPARDEKILTSWNGLMISALARSAAALGQPRFLKGAEAACDFLLSHLVKEGRLLRVYKDGRARFPAYLDDYAALISGLIDLHQATLDVRYLREAERLSEIVISDFADPEGRGFFYTTEEHTDVILRLKQAQDGSTPSGNSLAVYALLRLGRLTGREDYEQRAERTLRAYAGLMERAPGAFQHLFNALDFYLGPRQEVVVVGPVSDARTQAFLSRVQGAFLPRAVLLWSEGSGAQSGEPLPLLEGKTLVAGQPAVYVCRDFTCEAPVTTEQELDEALSRQVGD